MSRPHAIALLGFTPAERPGFESFFRLATKRVPGYRLVDDPRQCDLIIANADDDTTMHALLDHPPSAQVLLIGAHDADTGWAIQPRPIKLMNVMNAIDRMLTPHTTSPSPPPARRAKALTSTRPMGLEPSPEPAAVRGATPTSADDGILVVDDSPTALQSMSALLRRVGFTCETVRTAEQALDRLALRSYGMVFMDVVLEGMDGYQACKLIKQGRYAGGRPPVVVMLTSKAGPIDKIKGTMAGCDAYLVKPAEERALLKLLARYVDQVQRGFQATRLVGGAGRDAD